MSLTSFLAEWQTLAFETDSGFTLPAQRCFRVAWQGGEAVDPLLTRHEPGADGASRATGTFEGLQAEAAYDMPDHRRWVDERITLRFENAPARMTELSVGATFSKADLAGFTATAVPFRVGLNGASRVLDLGHAESGAHYAEGWVIDNGERGMLVMRVPSGSALTCFVPLVIEQDRVQIGSIGPDGADHRERSAFLDTEWENGIVELPTTRFVFFEGDWRTGFEVFREMLRGSLSRCTEPHRRPCPITYNTYHDFGPRYDKSRLVEIMPMLAETGFGMLHLDPGWETVWGSNVWNDEVMGTVSDFVAEAARHGLEVGCWTSVHSTDPDVFDGNYMLDSNGRKYYAEDFTYLNPNSERMWGSCPASDWRRSALENLAKLGRAGVRFLNSDFHDWPWSGESCHSREHHHSATLTRAQYAEALNGLYEDLHRACPDMVIELHDHVEAGSYRTPAWYLYDRPDSYDEKWAYEFMWTTYQDLMERKLFSLYYLRLAEPIPLFLHMNASSDNANALAFWYVASCVTHIGVGAILKASEEQKAAYKRAFEAYNARFEAFTLGGFHGIDELTHVHTYPDGKRAVIVAFNLEDEPVTRKLSLDPCPWDPRKRARLVAPSDGAISERDGAAVVTIGPKDVALVDLSIE